MFVWVLFTRAGRVLLGLALFPLAMGRRAVTGRRLLPCRLLPIGRHRL